MPEVTTPVIDPAVEPAIAATAPRSSRDVLLTAVAESVLAVPG